VLLPLGKMREIAATDAEVGGEVAGLARPSITMDLYVHEFETARRREHVGERLASALCGLIAE
jgi:hypothetical protein